MCQNQPCLEWLTSAEQAKEEQVYTGALVPTFYRSKALAQQ